jgi:adiponectin receptor
MDETRLWARTALDMLEGIRADVCSHLPELPFVDLSTMEEFVKSHLPDLPHLPNMAGMRSCLPDLPYLPDMAEMRSHLPDMPSLPDMDNVRTHISEMRLKLDDVRVRFHEIDFQKPFGYIPTLLDNLENLHTHLSSMDVPSGLPPASFTPNTVLSDLLDSLLNSDVVQDILNSTPAAVISEGEDILERAAHDVANAVKRSLEGVHLISYSDLPHQWRNNPFVTHGYR